MENFSLTDKTADELKELEALISAEFKRRAKERLSIAKSKIRSIIEEHDISPEEAEEIFAQIGKFKAKNTSEVRYRNPENADQVWSGRGRQPRWIKEALDAGKTLEYFLVTA